MLNLKIKKLKKLYLNIYIKNIMNSSSETSQISLLKFQLLVSNYQKHLLQEENQIFREEVEFLSDTEDSLRQQLHQQHKNFQLKINHFDSFLE